MIFKFDINKVGRSVQPLTGWQYHTPFEATIVSAVWYSNVKQNNIQYGLRLNFIPDKASIDSVNILYAFGNVDEQGVETINENSEIALLHNLTVLFDLKDIIDEAGMQEAEGLVTDVIFEKDKKRKVVKSIMAKHEPNLTGKKIGLILYRQSYVKGEEIKSTPRIFEIFNLETKQTGEDIRDGRVGSDKSLSELCLLAETQSENSLARASSQLQSQNKEKETKETLAQTLRTQPLPPLPIAQEQQDNIVEIPNIIDGQEDKDETNNTAKVEIENVTLIDGANKDTSTDETNHQNKPQEIDGLIYEEVP